MNTTVSFTFHSLLLYFFILCMNTIVSFTFHLLLFIVFYSVYEHYSFLYFSFTIIYSLYYLLNIYNK